MVTSLILIIFYTLYYLKDPITFHHLPGKTGDMTAGVRNGEGDFLLNPLVVLVASTVNGTRQLTVSWLNRNHCPYPNVPEHLPSHIGFLKQMLSFIETDYQTFTPACHNKY